MHIINSISSLQSYLKRIRRAGKQIGFVPTMGYLHQGHLSLIRKSKLENDITILSIFVNPVQFGPKEDFKAYPRDKKNDVLLAKRENIDIIFYPSVNQVYPGRYLTYIDVEEITNVMCGKFRPGHFRGVTTIVGKLLNIIQPDKIYLGQKDAQQCVIIKQMINDLNFSTKVKILPIIREVDGLAMSSRNKYLSNRQRKEAPVLYQSLKQSRKKILTGQKNASQIIQSIRKNIQKNSSGTIDYIVCVDADTLQPLKTIKGKTLIALAVWFGKARLIDNIILRIKNS